MLTIEYYLTVDIFNLGFTCTSTEADSDYKRGASPFSYFMVGFYSSPGF